MKLEVRDKLNDKPHVFLFLPLVMLLITTVQSVLPPTRVLIFLLPFFCMLAAKGILNLADFMVSLGDVPSKYRLNKILPVLIVLAFLTQRIAANILTEKHFSYDNEEAAEWLKDNLKPGDDLLVYCCEDDQIEYYMGQEFYSRHANIRSNVSRILVVMNPSFFSHPADDFARHELGIRGASEFELLKKIGRLNIYRSTELGNFTYVEWL